MGSFEKCFIRCIEVNLFYFTFLLIRWCISFRYIVDDKRVLFLLQDGSQVYEVKDYLVQQDRCQEVTIDNRQFLGKGATVNRLHQLCYIYFHSSIFINFRATNKQMLKIYENKLLVILFFQIIHSAFLS